MRKLRIAGIVVIVLLLATSTAAANAAVSAERTVLSGDYVKDALEEEGAYDLVASMMTEQMAAGIGGGGAEDGSGMPLPVDQAALVEGAITSEFVRGQAERNVDRMYGYLHGDRESAAVVLNLTPVRSNMATGIESQLREASLSELLAPAADDDGDLEMSGVAIDPAIFDDLAESESSYRGARAEFRAQVRVAVLDRAVEDTMADSSNDELLALVIEDYDPDEYTEAEKEEMVREREGEIETAVREEIESERADEIDQAVDEELESLPETVRSEMDDAPADVPPGVADSYADLVVVGVEGLSGEMSYETYTDRLEDAKAAFAADAAGAFESEMADDMPARATMMDTSNPEEGEALSAARRAVGIVDVLSIALPLVALALIGLLWWLTRSPAVTAAGAGVGLVLGGLPGLAAAGLLPSVLADALPGEVPTEFREVVLGLAERTASTVAGQSVAIVVVGLVLVAASIYLRTYGTPEWAQEIRA